VRREILEAVALDIDLSTPVRSLARYRELVLAIRDAPLSTQETNQVEWKSTADLGDRRWQAEMGRQVLGMANRDPDAAARVLGGCGYILVGVSPRSLTGTPVYDTANIEAWISPYVGQLPNAPAWAPAYIRVEDAHVLVLTVEPPTRGHPLWPCRKDYTPADARQAVREGAIYVRHMASTTEATAADIDMLSRRAGAARRRVSGISLALDAGSRAVALALDPGSIAAWTERERAALRPEPPAPSAQRETGSAIRADFASKASAELLANLEASIGKAFWEPDARTLADYQKEVDTYLAKAVKALPAVLLGRAYRAGLGRVTLVVHNNSDDPIRQLQVEVHVPGSGFMAMDEGDIRMEDLPNRPVALGKGGRRRFDVLAGIDMPGLRLARYGYTSSAVRAVRRSVRIDNSGSVRLTFDPLDLYAEQATRLEDVWLIAEPALAGTTLAAEWSARSRDASGVMRDTLEIKVDPRVWTIDELLASSPDLSLEDEEGG
jgi:hypothetical protein